LSTGEKKGKNTHTHDQQKNTHTHTHTKTISSNIEPFKRRSWSILLDYISKEDSSSPTSDSGKFSELKESGILLSAAVLGVPVGGYLLSELSPLIIRLTLGLTLISYGVFNLFSSESSKISDPEVPVVSALGAGFLAGVLGGTVSEPGPPVVVYSSFRDFEPAKTRR
jgi:hypothetical protein